MAWRTPDGTLAVHAVYGCGVTFDGKLLFVTRWRSGTGEISLEPSETLTDKRVATTGHGFDPDDGRTWAVRRDLWSQARVDKYISILRPCPLAHHSVRGVVPLYDQVKLLAEAGRLMAITPGLGLAAAMREAAGGQ